LLTGPGRPAYVRPSWPIHANHWQSLMYGRSCKQSLHGIAMPKQWNRKKNLNDNSYNLNSKNRNFLKLFGIDHIHNHVTMSRCTIHLGLELWPGRSSSFTLGRTRSPTAPGDRLVQWPGPAGGVPRRRRAPTPTGPGRGGAKIFEHCILQRLGPELADRVPAGLRDGLPQTCRPGPSSRPARRRAGRG
jgi:hypothetical protein